MNLKSLLHVIGDNYPVAIVLTDAHLESPGPYIEYANKAFSEMTGYTPEEVLGKSPRSFQGKRTNKVILKRLSRCLRQGKAARASVINYRRDGTPYTCDIVAFPVYDSAGTLCNFIAFEREVTRKPGRPLKEKTNEQWWKVDSLQ